jgi:hypothetical protein
MHTVIMIPYMYVPLKSKVSKKDTTCLLDTYEDKTILHREENITHFLYVHVVARVESTKSHVNNNRPIK